MKHAAFAALAVVAAAGLLARSASPVAACTCPPTNPTPTDNAGYFVGQAGVIVVGTVSDLVVAPPFDPQVPDEPYQAIANFPVEEYLKGSGPQALALNAFGLTVDENGDVVEAGLAGCQLFGLQSVGTRFVLFYPQGSALSSDPGYCYGSGLLVGQEGEAYLAELRAALQPVTPSPSPSPTAPTPTPRDLPDTGKPDPGDSDHAPLIAAGVAIPVALLLGAALMWRTRMQA